MSPVRIQRQRTKGWRMPVRWFYQSVVGRLRPPDLAAWLAPLRGRDLVCWCPLDQPCHADVLLELADR